MARPSKFEKEKLDLICKAVEVGATRKLAAMAAGIDVSTLYAWLQKGRNSTDPNCLFKEFSDNIKKAEGFSALRDLYIITAASENDWRAAAWRLERRHGYVVGQSHQIEAPVEANELDIKTLMEEIKESDKLISKLSGPVIDLEE